MRYIIKFLPFAILAIIIAAAIVMTINFRPKQSSNMMTLTSPAFSDGGVIPEKYSPFGENINPPLAWSDVPGGTRSFALIMDDPDAPAGVWDHWVVFNIPPSVTSIPEAWEVVGTKGAGTNGRTEYSGPRPPDREHRYYFTLYALDEILPLNEGATKSALLIALEDHVLAKAVLMGRFSPKNKS